MGVVLVTAAVLSGGCGPGSKGSHGPGGGREAKAVAAYPIARRIPADVSYTFMSRRVDLVIGALRDLLRPFGKIEDEFDVAALDREARSEFGLSPLDPADLADTGVAMDRNLALFGDPLPVLAVPVADGDKLSALIGRLHRGAPTVVSEIAGTTLSVVRNRDEFVAWAIFDGWLFVHFGLTSLETTTGWFEAISGAGPKLSHSDDLDWAQAKAPGSDFLGLVRWAPLLAGLGPLDESLSHTADCEALRARAAQAMGRFALGASLAEGKAMGQIFVELAEPVRAALAEHVAPGPDAAYRQIAAEAGMTFDLDVDLGWLGKALAPYGRRECGGPLDVFAELDLDEWSDPVAGMVGARPMSSYHFALLGGGVSFSGADVQAVGWFGVLDENSLRGLIGQLGPSQRRQIGPSAVEEVQVPGAASPVIYDVGGGVMRMATGKGLPERLFAKAAAPGPAEGVAGFWLRPEKVSDLVAALGAFGGREVALLATFLAQYKFVGVTSAMAPGGVTFQGGFELR